MYAHVTDGVVDRTGDIPHAWRLSDGRWISGFWRRSELWAEEGWIPLEEVWPALDPNAQYYNGYSDDIQADRVVRTHIVVPLPAEGINRKTIEDRARQALNVNASFLALSSPTQAEVLAQVRVLTKEASGLIRLLLRELASTDGT